MYLFQLRIENEMLQYENYLYKLSIKKKMIIITKNQDAQLRKEK